ncbi:MAG: DUF4157 domain-containing protein [Deltaproteobacteria bacterium]|nr:DUF4157 domain-containing protein [Deltaproteobacteria bacterium]
MADVPAEVFAGIPRGGGVSVPDATRAKMEASFAMDFGSVRIHEGETARAAGAEAFALGEDLHFAPGAFAPGTPRGDQLIGHELAHVAQQRAGRASVAQGKGGIGLNSDPALEAEADAAGVRAARGERVVLPGGGAAAEVVQRKISLGSTSTSAFSVGQIKAQLAAREFPLQAGDDMWLAMWDLDNARFPGGLDELIRMLVHMRGPVAPARTSGPSTSRGGDRDARSTRPEPARKAKRERPGSSDDAPYMGGGPDDEFEFDDEDAARAYWAGAADFDRRRDDYDDGFDDGLDDDYDVGAYFGTEDWQPEPRTTEEDLVAAKEAETFAQSPALMAASATSSWTGYLARLVADLANKRYAQDDGENGDVIAAVLLNHAHLAAFRELQPHLHEDQPRRQVSPLDRDDPLVYYRSQDKNHGQISLYKELMALAGFVNTKDKPMIAPHERALYPLYGLSMTGAPKTARAATTSQKNIATKRSGPPGKTKDLSGPTADYRTKGKHSEIHAAHLGLRKSNATAVPDAVHAAIAANPGGLQKLLAGKIASTGDQGALPLKVLPTTEAHLTAILDRLADLQNRLGALSDPPGADPTPGKAPTSDAEPDASDEILRDELDEAVDPLISTSVELRKLGQASTRGARMIADLPTLTHLRVAGQRGNPQITVEVARPLPVKDLNNKDFETFVDVLRTYFAAQVAVIAAQNGMELGIQLRQSFGFLDSSVTDTGASFRLSWGTEPPEFRHVIGLALQDLDRKLGAEYAKVKGKRDETRALLGVPPSGVKRPMQTMTAAADPRLVAYHKTVAASAGGGLPLADYLAYARSDDGANLPDPHAAPARGPVMRDGLGGDIDAHAGQRAAYLDSLEAASGAALRRIQGSKRTIASPMATASDQFDWELPICEPLANAIVMLSALVTQAMADGAYDPAQWSATRLGAIGQMSLAITQAEAAIEALAALAEVDGSKPTGAQQLLTVRSQVHNRLRNAAEELCEAMFVFMVTTNVHAFERPEDRTEAFLRETLRTDQVQVARTDSGEEASAFALGLLKEEQGSAFHLSFDSRETYFEVEDNVGEGGLAHTDRAPTVTPPTQKPAPKPDPTTYLVDPKPYLTTVDASRAVPAAFLAQVEVVRARVKSMPPPEVASKGVSSPSTATPKPAPPITIMADLTNTDLMNPEILLGILSMERETALGLVRFVLFNSGAKHEQAGLDKMHYGHLTVIGKVLAGMRDLNDSTLLNQFLGLFEDLRAAQSDGDDVGVRVDTWSRQFGTRAPAYDKFMVARGKGDAWLAAQLAFKEASAALDGALDKDQAQGLIADHARTGYKLLDAELDAVATTMALEFADDKVKVDDTVRAAFALLPKADQSEIQNRIVAHETGGRGGDFDDDFDDGFDAQASAATGIENVGNSCYLAAGLNLLAFVDTYYTIFAPKPADTPLIDTPAHVARRALRASVYAVLTGVRAGALVQGAAIRQLRALLDARGLLPPPSAQALAAGQTAMTAQQDPSEAIFRGLLAYFDADTAPMHLQGDEITDFTGAVQTPIVHAHPEQLGEIRPDHLVWRRAARELMLELPMPPGDDLTMQRLIDASLAVQQVPGVYARTAGGPISATVARSVEVTNLPTAVTITIKRAQFGQKDRRDVDAPEVLRIGDRWYRLKAIVHHKGHDMNHGHYTASTRNPLNGEWQYRDDSQVVADDAHFAERKNQGYMYAYELVPDGEDVPDGASARLPTADD